MHTWFLENSLCSKFKDSPVPSNVGALLPTIIQDHKNNDCPPEIDPELETSFGDTKYFFSSAQDPNEETLFLRHPGKISCALINHSAPTVFVHEGNFAKEHKLPIEAVLPFAFPHGRDGPKIERARPIL